MWLQVLRRERPRNRGPRRRRGVADAPGDWQLRSRRPRTFYAGLQSGSDDGIDVRAFDRGELDAHLLDTALDELDRRDFDYDGLFSDRWLTELFAGLGDGEANPRADTPRPHDAPEQGLFAAFLDEEYSRAGDTRPRGFEIPFGEGLPDSDSGPFEVERSDGSTVSIRGYIDRVDANDDGDDARLHRYDYKTGRSPAMTTSTGGTTFQLPIYLLAAEDVLSGVPVDEAHLSATYYQVRPPNDIELPRGVESKFDSQNELRKFLNEVVPSRLGTIDQAISNGRFHTTVLSAREANCRYCESRRCELPTLPDRGGDTVDDGDLPDNEECLQAVRRRWPDEVICPHCESTATRKKGTTSKNAQRYKCRDCARTFNDLTGTIFAGHRLSLPEMFYIVRHMDELKTAQIARRLDRSYKSVLEFVHKARDAREGDAESIVSDSSFERSAGTGVYT